MYKKFVDTLFRVFLNKEQFANYLQEQSRKALRNVLNFIRRVGKKVKNPRLVEAADKLEAEARRLGLL